MAGFSIAGIRVRIDQSWFIAFILFAWTLSSGYFPFQAPNYPVILYWVFGVLSTLGLFASVLVHELSHCVVARRLGGTVKQITLFIFGGVSEMAPSDSNTPETEFRIAIAGPLSSFGVGVVFAVLSAGLGSYVGHIADESLHYLFYVNFLLAAFNLIPGFPLDGGRILRSYLWLRSGDMRRATRSAARIGSIFATTMMTVGVFGFLSARYMLGIWLVLIGLFLRKSAENEFRSFNVRSTLQSFIVRDIMSPPIVVNKGTTVADFVNRYVFHFHERVFPVVDGNKFIGMIDLRRLKKIPAEDWPNTYIDAYISDSSEYSILHPDTDGREALKLLIETPMAKAAVVEGDAVVGALTRADLVEVISLKNDLAA